MNPGRRKKHRGFFISYDHEMETFCSELDVPSSLLFIVKKQIDNFVERNKEFEPFFVIDQEFSPSSLVKVIGINSCGEFVAKTGGLIFRISTSSEEHYVLYDRKMQRIIYQIERYRRSSEKYKKLFLHKLHEFISVETFEKNVDEMKLQIKKRVDRLNKKTLREIKQKYELQDNNRQREAFGVY